MKKKYRIGLVGCGAIAPIHLTALSELDLIQSLHLCDINPEAIGALSQYNPTSVHTDLHEMLLNTPLDVLHVCTPHFLHPDMVQLAVEAGINVLCEKPVGISTTQCAPIQTLLEANTSSQRRTPQVGICFQNRYNLQTQKALQLIQGGLTGKLLGGTAQVLWHRDDDYYQSSSWRGHYATEGGGVLINQAIHTLDLLRLFFGEPTNVQGFIANWGHSAVIEVEDNAFASLTFKDNASVLFMACNTCIRNQPVRIELTCEKAILLLEEGLTIHWHDGTKEFYEDLLPEGEKSYWGSSHKLLIEDFYNCLEETKPFMVTWLEGIRTLRVIEAIVGKQTL